MHRNNEMLFEITDDALLVANGGCSFSRTGVISVCASHLSDKQLGGVKDHFEKDDKQLVKAIRYNELGHYKDPNRVTSDFNNERETVHDYGGRFVWELLQNADDVMGRGRSSDGLIGSKGLGFKAVLEVTDEPEIHSGPFHFLFSATRTQELLKEEKLYADPPPLTFRIPHECGPDSTVKGLLAAGYTTVVRLPFRGKEGRKEVVNQLHALDALFLLLAQELSCVRIRTPESEMVHEITRQEVGLSSGDVRLSTRSLSGSQTTLWRRWVRSLPAPTDNSKQLTVAVCLPLSEKGDPVPHSDNVPFYVFFPTDEESKTRALVHASLDLEHNRKRVRQGEHDNAILLQFSELFQKVLLDIPARTALEAFGEVESDDRHSPLNELQNWIRDTLRETPFVPVIGGGRVKPAEVQLWQDCLGFVLRSETQEVRDARLLVPELSNLAEILKHFHARDVEDEDYIRLLRYCRKDSLMECFESWRVLATGGLKRVPSLYSRNSKNRERLLGYLRKVPCWWTETSAARALHSTRPLLFDCPKDWPDWLPADSLHPQMQNELKQWESDTPAEDDTPQIWKELVSERLLRERRDYFQYALLSFVDKWDEESWAKDGWLALRQALSWSVNREFESVTPWVEDADGNQQEKRRAKATKTLRLPTDKGWKSASDCYAGKAWDGPPTFDQFFASVKDRALLLPFHSWPTHIRKGTNKDQWKALLRWIGVSWEPKVRLVDGWPNDCLLENYENELDTRYYKWIYDWKIEFFPECIQDPDDGDRPARVIRTMLSLAETVRTRKAKFYSSYYYSRKKSKDSCRTNFAYYQLRHVKWLTCRPALFCDCNRIAPCDAFLPGKGLLGLLPEVDKSGIGDEEWFQWVVPKLRSLGVRDRLPDNPTDWHEWMRKLPALAEQLDESEVEAGGLCSATDALYRGYLKLDWKCDFPEDIDVPCLSWVDNREIFVFSPPCEVYYVGESHFDEVRRDILSSGNKLFLLKLKAGKGAPERLGVRPLSDLFSAEPYYDESDQRAGEILFQRYRERRPGLEVAANLVRKLPENLNLRAVRGLRLKLTSDGDPVTDVEVLSWKKKDDTLLINLDKNKWRTLGHGLAARIASEERNASLFENLLRESDKEGYLDRLRQEGVTEDDIRAAENAWSPGTSHEQSIDGDEPLVPGSPQSVAPGSQNLREEARQTSQQETSDGGGERSPSIRPENELHTPGNGGPRPRPETGRAAEDWFFEKLNGVFIQVERRVRDEKNRESDFVVSSDGHKVHIEVKHVENQPRIFYWSGLQCEKARDLERKDDQYYMAILFPDGEGAYETRWVWCPVDELKKGLREVQWEGHSEYEPVGTDSWDIERQRPDEVPTKRHKFRIKLNDETIEGFEKDTVALKALCDKIDNL